MEDSRGPLVVAPERIMRFRARLGIPIAGIAVLLCASAVGAHDLFLRPRDFFAKPGDSVAVRVLNGTFTTSETAVVPERLQDLSIVGPNGRGHPDRSAWTSTGKESGWRVGVGAAGTYVLGASLLPKTIHLTGDQFNRYLREEGLPDILASRRASGSSGLAAHERYAKHVKALVRVEGGRASPPVEGDTAFRAVLGYPAELVPLTDPYRTPVGRSLEIRALVDGNPAVRQVVLFGGRTESGKVIAERQAQTDRQGKVRVALDQRGTWYVKFIRMVPVAASAGDSVTHESKWATLTFAVR
jgi:uncharacterized GH25 family protein